MRAAAVLRTSRPPSLVFAGSPVTPLASACGGHAATSGARAAPGWCAAGGERAGLASTRYARAAVDCCKPLQGFAALTPSSGLQSTPHPPPAGAMWRALDITRGDCAHLPSVTVACAPRRPASVRAVAPHNPRYVKCPPRQPAAGVRPLRGVFSPARPGRRLRSRCGRYAPSAACSPPSFPSAPKGGSHKQQRSQKNSNGTQHCGAPADRYAFASLRLRVG